jgi:predicted nucleic acid-binding protein
MSAGRTLVRAVIERRFEAIPVQVVVSWGMLDRLRAVFAALRIDEATAEKSIDAIVQAANLGPEGTAPHLLLGGTGVIGVRDEEDRHVLETARAARAHLVATANFGDFLTRDSEILLADRVCIDHSPNWEIVVAVPQEAAGWLRRGIFPDAATIRRVLRRPRGGRR